MSSNETKKETAWHALDGDEVLNRLGTTPDGLDSQEAGARLEKNGPNRLPYRSGAGPFLRFLKQFHNILIYILIVAAVVTAALGHFLDTGVIAGVVLINALIGFIQEGKAEKALDAIRGMLSRESRVVRDGDEMMIAAHELVDGDVVLLQAGDKVPADLRLLKSRDLKIEEAVLTGESVASSKNVQPAGEKTALGDRGCMAFSGTLVTYGTGVGAVVSTGAHTELGRINEMLGSVEKVTTPLLRQMTKFGHALSFVILGLAAVAFFYGWLVMDQRSGEMFLAAVALSIAAIPEGLPAIMTITLAIGVRRMAQRHAIIRNLPSVDTLGSVTVICSDKTGTLTRNEMTVTSIILADNTISVGGAGYEPTGSFQYEGNEDQDQGESEDGDGGVETEGGKTNQDLSPDLRLLLSTGMLCTKSHLRQEENEWRLEGSPTDGAVLVAAMKAGLDRDTLKAEFPTVDSIPFASETRFSARLVRTPEGGGRIVMMGAPDALLDRCENEQFAGEIQPLERDKWREHLADQAARGLRVLGIAFKNLDKIPDTLEVDDVAGEMVLAGMVGIIDPPRREAVEAVAECKSAGIRVVMITGDHKLTAKAIAGHVGIHNEKVHTGAELEEASDEDLREWVRDTSVYARVSPEHKLHLVKALQAEGAVAAMTGDGVNDAPAIRRADVGVGMGITGTEVTKEAADMVLTDDNFASITHAVEEGRTVYDNLRKSILFILPTNGGEALTLLAAIVLGRSLPLTAAQILWVNMVTAVTLALALAFEPAEKDIMERSPRPVNASLLDWYFITRIIYVSVLVGMGTFGMFTLVRAWGYSLAQSQTMALNTLVMFEVFYLLNTRFITGSVLSLKGLFGSRLVLGAVAAVILAQVLYTYVPPMHWLFGSTPLSARDWLICIVPGIALLLLVELEKKIVGLPAVPNPRRVAAGK